jgi:hypothetical protein
VSPNKTVGALGSAATAAVVAVVASAVGLSGLFAIAMLAIVLSVLAQAGGCSIPPQAQVRPGSSLRLPGMAKPWTASTASSPPRATALIGLARGALKRRDEFAGSESMKRMRRALPRSPAPRRLAHGDAPQRHQSIGASLVGLLKRGRQRFGSRR